MKHIVFLLEEESAKELIDNLLPRIFPSLTFHCIPFEGKQDLEKNIAIKLRGYKTPNTEFVILRDEDSGDCKEIKHNLDILCKQASKPYVLIRIACKELEAWYFGDLVAVEKALSVRNLNQYSKQSRYRVPDRIVQPKKELIKLTKGKYSQVSGSREISKHLDFENNSSASFNIFIEGIRKII